MNRFEYTWLLYNKWIKKLNQLIACKNWWGLIINISNQQKENVFEILFGR